MWTVVATPCAWPGQYRRGEPRAAATIHASVIDVTRIPDDGHQRIGPAEAAQ
jgi:hypothetical protein